jgi:hypothetical protein
MWYYHPGRRKGVHLIEREDIAERIREAEIGMCSVL